MKNTKVLTAVLAVAISGCAVLETASPSISQRANKYKVSSSDDSMLVAPQDRDKANKGTIFPAPGPSPLTPPPETQGSVEVAKPFKLDFSYLDRQQSTAQMQDVIADGKPHAVSILFSDRFNVRVAGGKGRTRDKAGNGFHALSDTEGVLTSLEVVLSKQRFKAIYPSSLARGKAEAELEATESQRSKLVNYDLPNDGSWAYLELENYSPQAAKDLVLQLQSVKGVRKAYIVPNGELAAVMYRQPPSDEHFQNPQYWQYYDLNSDKSDNAGLQVQSWWWNRHSVGVAWPNGKRGAGVRVAVIDSSFQTDNNDGIDFDTAAQRRFAVNSSNNTVVETSEVRPNFISGLVPVQKWHGTAVAHLIGAKPYNSKSLCGVAPDVTIIPIAVDANVQLSYPPAIRWAVSKGAEVINISTGVGSLEGIDETKVELGIAFSSGITTVVSAGNSNQYLAGTPYETGAICVGGINKTNTYWYKDLYNGSSYGPRVDIAAAAENVSFGSNASLDQYGALTTNSPQYTLVTARDSGTSFAAPLVAGACALVRQYVKDPSRVRENIIHTSDWTYGNDRQMNSNYNGTDSVNKIRVLNAGSAVQVASSYTPGYPYQVYRPASVNYTQTETCGGGWQYNTWFPENHYVGFAAGSCLETWEYNNTGGKWAGATVVFKNRVLHMYKVTGTPWFKDAMDQLILPAYNNDPNGSAQGWVNQFTFPLN